MLNFTCAHESRIDRLGEDRLRYPDHHIEVDNRLAWFLGRLEETYHDDACYVHLKRNENDTAASFAKRYNAGIIRAYSEDILLHLPEGHDPYAVCLDYCHTVNSNIQTFLNNKEKKMVVHLENAKADFRIFWEAMGAEGNLEEALREWDVRHNKSTTASPAERIKNFFSHRQTD